MVKTSKAEAKLMSEKYGREITPEQCDAVKYFVEEEAMAEATFARMKGHDFKICQENKREIELKVRKDLYSSGSLDELVKRYSEELSDKKVQEERRKERIQKRICIKKPIDARNFPDDWGR